MCPEGPWAARVAEKKMTRTCGHDIPRRYVEEQASYSDLRCAPDQEQGDTCIKIYKMVTIQTADVDPHHACVHPPVRAPFKQDNLALTTFLGCLS